MEFLNYVGFGFSINDVAKQDLINLFKTKNQKEYNELASKDDSSVLKEIIRLYGSRAGFLAEIICVEERKNVYTEIVEVFGNYIVFQPITFVDDYPQLTSYIKNRNDFQNMIKKYVSITDVLFDNVYEHITPETTYYDFNH